MNNIENREEIMIAQSNLNTDNIIENQHEYDSSPNNNFFQEK